MSNYKYAKVHIQTQKLQECLKLITSKLLSLSDDIDGPMLDYPSHIGKYWKVFINIASKTHKDRHRVAGLVLEALKKYPKIIKSITLDIDPTQREYL